MFNLKISSPMRNKPIAKIKNKIKESKKKLKKERKKRKFYLSTKHDGE
jgi:hypothetical protein